MKRILLSLFFPASIILQDACTHVIPGSKEAVSPVPVSVAIPKGFPYMNLNGGNPATREGIQLGRMLFFDPIIDKDNKRTCGGCHIPGETFSSHKENSLSQVNLVWNYTFLWNGKVEGTLEDIMIFEVDSFFKTDLDRINGNKKYRKLFRQAFGVGRITSREIGYALAQFERTLISCNSKYDRYLRGDESLTAREESGRRLYFTERGDCFHCHGTILLTDNTFHNNGLDSFPGNHGRYEITGKRGDAGKYKTPTLRNVELTAPYMHDGRFKSLRDVIDFYSEKLCWSPTIDPLMKKVKKRGVRLTEQEKDDLMAFLKTFTDTSFATDHAFSDLRVRGK